MTTRVFVRHEGRIILAEQVVTTKVPEYKVWDGMRLRCTNPNHVGYPRYGGAGVTICARWKKFKAFYEDMGPRPGPGYTIDRKDGTRGYEPGNCRWATREEQALNKSNAVFVEFEGERQRLVLLCKRFGIGRSVVDGRLKKGWPLRDALNTPVGKRGRRRKAG